MRMILTIGIVAVGLIFSTASLRADTVYMVNIPTVAGGSPYYYGAIGSLKGTITTDGALNINPYSDILGWNLTFTYAPSPETTFTFTSANSTVVSGWLGGPAQLSACTLGLCIVSGKLEFKQKSAYLSIGLYDVTWSFPFAGLFPASAKMNYDPSVNGYALTNTPIPAALPLFASGIGLLLLLMAGRRRTKTSGYSPIAL